MFIDLNKFLSVVAQRSLVDCKRTADNAMTSSNCDDVTVTSLKDAHLVTLPCNHVPLGARRHGELNLLIASHFLPSNVGCSAAACQLCLCPATFSTAY